LGTLLLLRLCDGKRPRGGDLVQSSSTAPLPGGYDEYHTQFRCLTFMPGIFCRLRGTGAPIQEPTHA